VPLAKGFRLRATEVRCGCSAMSQGDERRCQRKPLDGASVREEKACPDCLMTKNQLVGVCRGLVDLSTIFNGSTKPREVQTKPRAQPELIQSVAGTPCAFRFEPERRLA